VTRPSPVNVAQSVHNGPSISWRRGCLSSSRAGAREIRCANFLSARSLRQDAGVQIRTPQPRRSSLERDDHAMIGLLFKGEWEGVESCRLCLHVFLWKPE
jgi:hypothetical protein